MTTCVKTWILAAVAGLQGMAGAAQASLIDAGNGLINDTTQNLVWQQNANLAATETFGVPGINANGTMSWNVAQQWIAAMNAADYKGYDDWRFWSALNGDGSEPCFGLNCNGSEMGHLFFVDGGLIYGSAINSSETLNGLFTNMQSSVYWSGTQFADNFLYAWVFFTPPFTGQGFRFTEDQFYGWAVRSGQVAAAPLPATGVLMALGLMALGKKSRKRGSNGAKLRA
jgi:hypothetical protein